MGLSLRKDVSFCRIDDRTVFLDARRDRFFAVSEEVHVALATSTARRTVDAKELGRLQPLIAAGVLIRTDRPNFDVLGTEILVPEQSLFEEAHSAPSVSACVQAVGYQSLADALVRVQTLSDVIRHVRRSKRRVLTRAKDELYDDRVKEVAAAFRRADRVRTVRDRCLPRSIGMMMQLARRGCSATMVIGVRLDPFGSHCWVQTDRSILSDPFGRVRPYSPILTI
ncbi:lasso peptide biosynthesis B2 protein [Brevundimonas abyssalis]|uniref:lasso peptide biosynthesis B2 protein n=1 Tax=Brevundimonas abyssalis TaxID=1125965 RepID=UPI0026A15F8F